MTIFFNFSPTSNHLHPPQVENCDSNSRLVVDDDENGKFRDDGAVLGMFEMAVVHAVPATDGAVLGMFEMIVVHALLAADGVVLDMFELSVVHAMPAADDAALGMFDMSVVDAL